jgi:hypothetical protein
VAFVPPAIFACPSDERGSASARGQMSKASLAIFILIWAPQSPSDVPKTPSLRKRKLEISAVFPGKMGILR